MTTRQKRAEVEATLAAREARDHAGEVELTARQAALTSEIDQNRGRAARPDSILHAAPGWPMLPSGLPAEILRPHSFGRV